MTAFVTISCITRLIYTLRRRLKFDSLVTELKENFPSKTDYQDTVSQAERMLKKYLKMYGFVYAAFIVLNFAQLIELYAKHGPIKLDTIWMPFNYQTALRHFFASIYIIAFNFVCLVTKYFTDFLLFEVTTLLSIELKVCACMAKENFNNLELNLAKLQNFIDYHTKINGIAKELEDYFSLLMLLCYFDYLAVISILGFLIAVARNVSDMIAFLMQMIILMIQLFFPFYFSQMVIDSSESIATTIMESNWNEIKDKKIRKMIILILLASQQKRCLRAKGYKVVSYQDYTHIITTAHSYIAVMRHLYYN